MRFLDSLRPVFLDRSNVFLESLKKTARKLKKLQDTARKLAELEEQFDKASYALSMVKKKRAEVRKPKLTNELESGDMASRLAELAQPFELPRLGIDSTPPLKFPTLII